MRITERLNVEHGVYLNLLQQIEDRLNEGATAEATTIARALIRLIGPHCEIEDRVLYPALAEAVSADIAPLRRMEADHRELAQLSDEVAFGLPTRSLLESFVGFTRDHIEREIHLMSPLIQELVPEARLVALCDWSADHLRERAARTRRVRSAE